MRLTPIQVSNRARSINWGEVADWIARRDRQLPIYHRLCILAWSWTLGQALQEPLSAEHN
jgi:hypothetical protein